MSAKDPAANRPLSPFMLGQYYRFQLSSALSFLHRITGVGLAIGSLGLAAWVLCAAMGPEQYAAYTGFAASPFGQFLLICWSWALFYHACNGVRHLVWDGGKAFERSQVDLGGWIVVLSSLALTAVLWLVVCFA
ncbi:MAG: succinate dehydrogenase, cytochrome b556 subunit [Nevskiaceae bacterium]|nr:MAG: succinate dehydrogenase, cytochrome b556 subunit [Nevskiaceae bacterium]TBR73999.1 MAG: succinate dehydrogenase, cytochrome b556 subunit [Nevskiaceae bacterium]